MKLIISIFSLLVGITVMAVDHNQQLDQDASQQVFGILADARTVENRQAVQYAEINDLSCKVNNNQSVTCDGSTQKSKIKIIGQRANSLFVTLANAVGLSEESDNSQSVSVKQLACNIDRLHVSSNPLTCTVAR